MSLFDYNNNPGADIHNDIDLLVEENISTSESTQIIKNIINKFDELSSYIDFKLSTGIYDKLPAEELSLLMKINNLQSFYTHSEEIFKPAIDDLKITGLFKFLKACRDHDADPLLSIALTAMSFDGTSHEPVFFDKQIERNTKKFPELQAFLNELSIVSACELGLISHKQAALLSGMEHEIQNKKVQKLYGALIYNVVDKIEETLKSVQMRTDLGLHSLNSNLNPDKTVEKLLSDKDFNRFARRVHKMIAELEINLGFIVDAPEEPVNA